MENDNFEFMCSYSGKPISFGGLKSMSSVMYCNCNLFFIEEDSKPGQVLNFKTEKGNKHFFKGAKLRRSQINKPSSVLCSFLIPQ